MSGILVGSIAIASLLALLAWRVPVALSLILVSFLGVWATFGLTPAWGILKSTPYDFVASWTLTSVPMFVLMGYISFHSGITSGLFRLAKALFSRMPGSLAISSTFACTGFAAVCGSSVACAAAMGKIAIPEMVKSGYDRNFACGSIAAGGTIGALIPPSILMIIYGVIAQVSIISLFLAGIGVGVATAIGYILVILALSWVKPEWVPRSLDRSDVPPLGKALMETGPVLFIMAGIFGGMFGGIFTATEAGAVGAALSLGYAVISRRINRRQILESLSDTVSTCGSLLLVGVGAAMLTKMLSMTGLGLYISQIIGAFNFDYWQLMLMIVAIYLVLGMFLDPFGAMLITLPVFLPILHHYHVDLIFFGVFLVKMLEIGMMPAIFGRSIPFRQYCSRLP